MTDAPLQALLVDHGKPEGRCRDPQKLRVVTPTRIELVFSP